MWKEYETTATLPRSVLYTLSPENNGFYNRADRHRQSLSELQKLVAATGDAVRGSTISKALHKNRIYGGTARKKSSP